jgi:hypothetical protein
MNANGRKDFKQANRFCCIPSSPNAKAWQRVAFGDSPIRARMM